MKPLFAVLGAGIVLLIVVANWPWPKSAPSAASETVSKSAESFTQMPPELRAAEASTKRAERLAVQAKGNFSRLSADDQSFLNTVSHGHGRQYIEASYKRDAASFKSSQSTRTAKEGTPGATSH